MSDRSIGIKNCHVSFLDLLPWCCPHGLGHFAHTLTAGFLLGIPLSECPLPASSLLPFSIFKTRSCGAGQFGLAPTACQPQLFELSHWYMRYLVGFLFLLCPVSLGQRRRIKNDSDFESRNRESFKLAYWGNIISRETKI